MSSLQPAIVCPHQQQRLWVAPLFKIHKPRSAKHQVYTSNFGTVAKAKMSPTVQRPPEVKQMKSLSSKCVIFGTLYPRLVSMKRRIEDLPDTVNHSRLLLQFSFSLSSLSDMFRPSRSPIHLQEHAGIDGPRFRHYSRSCQHCQRALTFSPLKPK